MRISFESGRRQILEPITMMPVAENGRRFYRAMGDVKALEMLDRLGLAQAVDFCGCEGPQPAAATRALASLGVRE